MTFRTVTLTAVAALSLGMAEAQETRTITVPLGDPGTAAPEQTGPGTVVTRTPEGETTVESVGTDQAGSGDAGQAGAQAPGDPQPARQTTFETTDSDASGAVVTSEGAGNVVAGTSDTPADADVTATGVPAVEADEIDEDAVDQGGGDAIDPESTPRPTAEGETPAPAAPADEAQADAQTGTAAPEGAPAEPAPTDTAGEPPAAPQEGLPDTATEETVTSPVPAAEGAAQSALPDALESDADAEPADQPAEPDADTEAEPAADADADQVEAADGDAVASEGIEGEAPADEAPAAIQNPETTVDGAEGADTAVTTSTVEAGTADAEGEAADAPSAEDEPADAQEAAADPQGENAEAAEEAPSASHSQEIEDVAFSFEGPFGTYDQFQLQRGLQVYTEVCSGCHGMKQVPLRTLSSESGPGLPEDQVRAYAAEMFIMDEETGEERPRLPTDPFPTVVGDGMGPDLSLMAKARAGFHGPYGTGLSQLFNGIGGPEYIYSVLAGYTGETKEEAGTTYYENHAFPGGWIAMAPPLFDDGVTFEDGSPTDVQSQAKDIAAFLMWTAEPKMMERKQVGLVSVLFLIVLSVLLYLTNKRLWWPLKHGRDRLNDGR